MKKKILIVSILAVFMLVAISYATAINTNTANAEKKESPLYMIRTRRAVTEKISKLIDNVKTRFIGERLFFLPFQWLRQSDSNLPSRQETMKGETYYCPTCADATVRCTPVLCGGMIISILIDCTIHDTCDC